MSEPEPRSRMSGKSDPVKNMLGLIGYGYLVVFLFLSVFFLFLAEASKLGPGLSNPRWSLLLAIVLVLPLLVPALKYIAPYVKSIKISEFEVSFAQLEVASLSLSALAEQLKTAASNVSAQEYASMMTSYSSVIIDTIKAVQTTKDEVLVVDLREGNAWIPPNLYFLASLAADRTLVRQIAFVETRHVEGVFVGMCFPEELRKILGDKFPVLPQAAESSNYKQLPMDQTGGAYFNALRTLYSTAIPAPSPRDSWLNSHTLFALAGSCLKRQKIESKEWLTERDDKQILQSEYPYTAAVRDEQLESIISRDKLAVFVAREVVARAAI